MEDPSTLRRLRRTLTKENLWLYVLSILVRKRVHAYGMGEEMERAFRWKHGLITTYVVLYRLEAEGLISSEYEARRKYYRITRKGKTALADAKKLLRRLASSL